MVVSNYLATLFESAQKVKTQFNQYVKKMDFEAFLRLLLHAIPDEKESLRHLENTVMNSNQQLEVGLESRLHSQLAQSVLLEISFN